MKYRVAVIRDLPEEKRASMDRYAADLAGALEGIPSSYSVSISQTPVGDDTKTFPLNKLGNYRRRFIEYPEILKSIDADVYHVVDHSYAHLLRVLDVTRTVVTCHDLMLLTQREWAGKVDRRPALYLFRYSTSFLRKARWIVAVSETTRDDLVRLGLAQADRVTVIPPGLSPQFRTVVPESSQSYRERLGIGEEDLVILSVGSTNPYKNLEGVVNTAIRASSLASNIVLLRAGRPLPPSLAARLEQAEQVRYIETGPVSDQDLVSAYHSASVLLFPSLKEGFGWPVIEAMYFGCPVVTSTERTITSNVGDAALRFDPNDSEGMARAIISLGESETMSDEFRGRGFEVASRFTWEDAAIKIGQLYESI